jgi:hypothetical protein
MAAFLKAERLLFQSECMAFATSNALAWVASYLAAINNYLGGNSIDWRSVPSERT